MNTAQVFHYLQNPPASPIVVNFAKEYFTDLVKLLSDPHLSCTRPPVPTIATQKYLRIGNSENYPGSIGYSSMEYTAEYPVFIYSRLKPQVFTTLPH